MLPAHNTIQATRPFEYLVLDVKHAGTDIRTFKPAVLILFMDAYTGIVFHSLYTTQTGQTVLIKFLRYLGNKYNFGNLNISYSLITAFDQPFEPIIKMFLEDCNKIIFDVELSNRLCGKVRNNFVSHQ